MLPAPLTYNLESQTRPPADLGAVEGDLRPVTILFADIRGFTRLAEVLPPEKLVAAINGCFEVLDEAIARYGGEVDKFLVVPDFAQFPPEGVSQPCLAEEPDLVFTFKLESLGKNLVQYFLDSFLRNCPLRVIGDNRWKAHADSLPQPLH